MFELFGNTLYIWGDILALKLFLVDLIIDLNFCSLLDLIDDKLDQFLVLFIIEILVGK